MGTQILKISPFTSSTTLIFNATPFLRFQAKRVVAICGHPRFSSSSVFIPSSKKGFAAMAAQGSVHKSEEDWRAILSPEQFRILRQKGTECFGPDVGEFIKGKDFILIMRHHLRVVSDNTGANIAGGDLHRVFSMTSTE